MTRGTVYGERQNQLPPLSRLAQRDQRGRGWGEGVSLHLPLAYHRADPAGAPHGGEPASVRQLHRPFPATWWLQRRSYFLFMLREFTSLFVAAYAVLWIVLAAVSAETFQSILAARTVIALHVPVLLMALYHTYTWFQATPQVMPVWRGEKRVSSRLISGVHWLAWLVVTVAVLAAVKLISGA